MRLLFNVGSLFGFSSDKQSQIKSEPTSAILKVEPQDEATGKVTVSDHAFAPHEIEVVTHLANALLYSEVDLTISLVEWYGLRAIRVLRDVVGEEGNDPNLMIYFAKSSGNPNAHRWLAVLSYTRLNSDQLDSGQIVDVQGLPIGFFWDELAVCLGTIRGVTSCELLAIFGSILKSKKGHKLKRGFSWAQSSCYWGGVALLQKIHSYTWIPGIDVPSAYIAQTPDYQQLAVSYSMELTQSLVDRFNYLVQEMQTSNKTGASSKWQALCARLGIDVAHCPDHLELKTKQWCNIMKLPSRVLRLVDKPMVDEYLVSPE